MYRNSNKSDQYMQSMIKRNKLNQQMQDMMKLNKPDLQLTSKPGIITNRKHLTE